MGRRPPPGDIALGLALLVGGLAEVWGFPVDGMSTADRIGVSAGLALTATTLVFRRVYPVGAPLLALAWMLIVDVAWTDSYGWLIAGVMLTAYSAGRHATRRGALLVLAALVAYGVYVNTLEEGTVWEFIGNLLFLLALMVVIPWGAGMALHHRQRVGVAEVEKATESERLRIARELHDIVGHALGVIVIQAEGERATLPAEADSTRKTLATIAQTARDALDDVRRLVTVMREDTDRVVPQPGLGEVRQLVDGVTAIGVPCALVIDGEPRELPAGVDLSAYRVIQEALTNTVRHGLDARAQVTVRYTDRGVDITVEDDGRPAAGSSSRGFGLLGMRERVGLYGGTVEAAPRAGGGFAVRVHLPTQEEATDADSRARL